MLTPEQRAEWRDQCAVIEREGAISGVRVLSERVIALLDALDAAEASAAEHVTAALDEVARAIRKERHDRLSQMERNGMKVAELVVREVRQSLIEGEKPCRCGSPETCSLNPTEVVVHRRDGQPCYIAPVEGGEVRS